ncbi:MAG: VCBS repeat-containing protein, partial [Saprospiraceae bacterium]|nr:VCBS repeat-containing protein [Saprospiraceae bacterium]
FVGVNNSAVAFADIDGDGDQDVLVSGRSAVGNFTELFLNGGSGNFTAVKGNTLVGYQHGRFGIGDLNRDGYPDVLYLGRGGAPSFSLVAELYANDGQAFFSPTSLSSSITFISTPQSIRFADVDQDHDLDVLVTGWDAANVVSAELYANEGNGNLSMTSQNNLANMADGILEDTDSDGDQDLLLWGHDSD